MITTDHVTAFENLAGVPSAGDLTILANRLFPDLTEGVFGNNPTDVANTGSFEEAQVTLLSLASSGRTVAVSLMVSPTSISAVDWLRDTDDTGTSSTAPGSMNSQAACPSTSVCT